MVKIVYGPKGFGKTKIMIDEVNAAANASKGNVVFITDKSFSTVSIDFSVRMVYTADHEITNSERLIGLITGLMAGNSDIEYIFIDGLKRIIGDELVGSKDLFEAIKELMKEYTNLKFVLSVSAERKDLPDCFNEFIQ